MLLPHTPVSHTDTYCVEKAATTPNTELRAEERNHGNSGTLCRRGRRGALRDADRIRGNAAANRLRGTCFYKGPTQEDFVYGGFLVTGRIRTI